MSKSLFDLTGKTAIVTGSTKGIGLAIAQKLASHGANIVITSRTAVDCENIAKEIEKSGVKTLAIAADISKVADIETLFNKTIEKFGKVDIVVNNSGVGVTKPAVLINEQEMDSMLDLNIKGVFFMCTAAAKQMKTQENRGCIINISSNAAYFGVPMMSVYATTKAAVVHLTKSLALEWAADNIRVNSVAPGTVPTEMTKSLMDDTAMCERIKQSIPLKKFASTEDIANAALYLASDEAAMVTGATIVVDGGRHAV